MFPQQVNDGLPKVSTDGFTALDPQHGPNFSGRAKPNQMPPPLLVSRVTLGGTKFKVITVFSPYNVRC
jgi:hypothetical protein